MEYGGYTGQNELKGNMFEYEISTKYLNVVLSLLVENFIQSPIL